MVARNVNMKYTIRAAHIGRAMDLEKYAWQLISFGSQCMYHVCISLCNPYFGIES